MSLSSLVVQREIASIREVEEALARQVLYGGDLVTNLLEVCRVDENALGAVVSEWFGLQAAPAGELPKPPAEALRVLAAEIAAQRSVAPLSIDVGGLVVAVAEPLTREVEQELAFALAVPITQRIAPLVRIRQALARDYGMPMDRRLTRLLGKMTGEVPRVASAARAPVVAAPPRAPSVPDRIEKVEPPKRPPGTPSTLLRDAAASPAPGVPTRRRRGPFTAEAAQNELEDAAARDKIFELVFDFARQFFDYTAIFLVHGDIAEGRDGYGEGAPRDKVLRVGVPLDLPGILASSRNTKKVVRETPDKDGLDGVLLADLGRPGGTLLVALPIVVRTRVVAILLGDVGEGGADDVGIGQVEGIVSHAVAAFERLIVRRKLQGTQPPDSSAARAKAAENPNLEGVMREAARVRAHKPSVPPAAEELAAPVRELMADAPPPAGILSVRKHSGPPIPREEPDADAHPPPTRVSGAPAAEARRRSSGGVRKPEAPPLSFEGSHDATYGAGYGEDPVERRLLAEIEGRDGPATQPTSAPIFDSAASSPRAASSPPPAGENEQPVFRSRSMTDPSPGVMLPAHDPDATPLAPPVVDDEPTPRMPPVFADEGPPAVSVAPVMTVDAQGVTSSQRPPAAPSSDAAALAEAVKPASKKKGAAANRDKPMPASEQQVSVAAHRPPSSHEDVTRVLPSVIVDVDDEYDASVVRALEDEDEEAEAALLRAGAKAMPSLMARFPGKITVARGLLDEGLLPRASECGPVLRLVAAQRRIALPFVLEVIDTKDDNTRLWATYLLGELAYPESVEALVPRVFDDNPQVRRVARLALRALADSHPGLVVDKLGSIAKGREQPTVRRTRAVEALGDTREENAVPILASLVNDTAGAVANAARIALVLITRHDYGHDARAWFQWWDDNGERHRLEWLMDALLSESSVLRASAGDELKAITKEYFGYYEDLPKREREKVQARYRQWWNEIGRVRFSRSPRSS